MEDSVSVSALVQVFEAAEDIRPGRSNALLLSKLEELQAKVKEQELQVVTMWEERVREAELWSSKESDLKARIEMLEKDLEVKVQTLEQVEHNAQEELNKYKEKVLNLEIVNKSLFRETSCWPLWRKWSHMSNEQQAEHVNKQEKAKFLWLWKRMTTVMKKK